MIDVALIEKIQHLPPEKISEVEDFVDFLSVKHSTGHADSSDDNVNGNMNLSDLGIGPAEAAAQRAALESFAEDWESPEMEVYDQL